MEKDALQYVINELSVGNWAQNLAFYTLLSLLGWVISVQIKTSSRASRKRQTASK
jgi:hypothetical protein